MFLTHSILLALIVFMSQPWLTGQTHPDASSSCGLCFYGPDNIVFVAVGNAYITDTDHKSRFRVLKVSPDGKPIDEWHIFEEGQGRRKGPEGIAIDRDGNILVTDGGTSSVLKISPGGKVLERISCGSTRFEDLGHIVVDSFGNVYVAEAGPNLIQKFSPGGERIAAWKKAKGSGPGQWSGPETIAIRRDGTLVVEDWGNHRIVVLSPSGNTLFSFGERGSKPGQFASSSGLATDRAGNIYVPDEKLHRLQKFDASGRLLSTFANNEGGTPLFVEGPGGVAIDNHGNVYTPDGKTVIKLSPNGHLLERWR
jgi:sugar lactone lactonase YvrE